MEYLIEKALATALENLAHLVEIPSCSRQEDGTAEYLLSHLSGRGIAAQRVKNNVWALNRHFAPKLPTLLLCSHHDTVRPAAGYTRNPYRASLEQGRLYGLGSNDAGAPLVSLIEAFARFYPREGLRYNLALAAVAEEECSGADGVSALWEHLPPIDCAIVGEPTGMRMAVAEKSLIVVDCTAQGRSGHAAREEGDNAIYKAVQDIEAIRRYEFPRVSPTLGKVKMTVTMIQAGTQHNVIPDKCTFTVDIRTTDAYTNREIMDTLQGLIASDHPLGEAGRALGLDSFGSPTMSDAALLPCPCLKIGPGLSERSHTADEYVEVAELEQGIRVYGQLLERLLVG